MHTSGAGGKNRAPGSLSMCSPLLYYKGITMLENMHTPGAQVLKSVHPAAKLCTQGAGCTLYFEHCTTSSFIYKTHIILLIIVHKRITGDVKVDS